MAFNFNWSPLIADTSRAREMLTAALNKSPKPPIIVDDIIVTELNLGSVPPELEILEIGDLAEDRFRGIFKMQYSGDAYMTLKTRVQANPLNTYLSAKPPFASPQPLAAASGLTIPLQITLSDIKLSGFVILVFSKQKGITLVFRNDPLDSLKVSSTFDSIPFVRDYLQKEIEGQLRLLFMEDLPAIIHRLSLRLWSPEHASQADINSNRIDPSDTQKDQLPVDPLSSPSQAPRDGAGAIEDPELSFSLDDSTTSQASFSQKNLLRLAALTDSHRTLSLFTPPVKDVVYRAWAGAAEGRDSRHPTTSHQLNRSHSGTGITLASLSRYGATGGHSRASSVYSASTDPGAVGTGSAPSYTSRPSLSSYASASHAYSTGDALSNGMRSTHQRKRKHRVVNLRKPPATAPLPKENPEGDGSDEDANRPKTPTSYSAPGSTSWATTSEREGELQTPPDSPERRAEMEVTPQARRRGDEPSRGGAASARQARALSHQLAATTPRPQGQSLDHSQATIRPTLRRQHRTEADVRAPMSPTKTRAPGLLQMPIPLTFGPLSSSAIDEKLRVGSPGAGAQPGGILEQAWMMKMAAEIGRRVELEGEKRARGHVESGGTEAFWNGDRPSAGADAGVAKGQRRSIGTGAEEEDAPPAYAA